MQTDWIGKSYGAEVDFPIDGRDEKITVYTTRPDTLYGATFMVLAPEHELAKSLATDDTREAVEKYIFDSSMRSNVDRMQAKEKLYGLCTLYTFTNKKKRDSPTVNVTYGRKSLMIYILM